MYYHIGKVGDYRRCVELREVCRSFLYFATVCRHSPFGECAAVGISSWLMERERHPPQKEKKLIVNTYTQSELCLRKFDQGVGIEIKELVSNFLLMGSRLNQPANVIHH
jgi:hypothetical protein